MTRPRPRSGGGADRTISAGVAVDASPERVWEVVTDPAALIGASPELFAVTPLHRGAVPRIGKRFIGWNRRGAAVWPCLNVVRTLDDRRAYTWDTTTSGARWSFEIEPDGSGTTTRLTQTRTVPRRLTTIGRITARLLLGGGAAHTDQLEKDIVTTLAHLKEACERPVTRSRPRPSR